MFDIFMAIGIVILMFGFSEQVLLLWLILKDRTEKHISDGEQELDEKVQQAMEEEERRSRAMDEGFDNMMRYSVNGSDGFDAIKSNQ